MREHYFSADLIQTDPILAYFDYKHLPSNLQGVSALFANFAELLYDDVPRSAERTMAFRKLLEAKDCAIRAAL